MNFGQAIEDLKDGKCVKRLGWNGKGMFLYYVPANRYQPTTEAAREYFGEAVPYNAYIAIKNADNTVSTWTPSIGDVLAEDWFLIHLGEQNG